MTHFGGYLSRTRRLSGLGSGGLKVTDGTLLLNEEHQEAQGVKLNNRVRDRTIAAAALGAILYTVVTSDSFVTALTNIINRALNTSV